MDNSNEKIAWYYKSWFLLLAFSMVGPFALPLLWVHPRYSQKQKWLWTIVVLALTWVMVVLTIRSVEQVMTLYKELKAQGIIQ